MSSVPQTNEIVPPVASLVTGTLGEEILCSHCRRTATNGIKCKGICVADSDY